MASVVQTPWIGLISEAQDRKAFLKLQNILRKFGDFQTLSESLKRQFHWIDHTRMSFSNWAPGEPNGHNSETIVEDVAEMYPYTYGYVF